MVTGAGAATGGGSVGLGAASDGGDTGRGAVGGGVGRGAAGRGLTVVGGTVMRGAAGCQGADEVGGAAAGVVVKTSTGTFRASAVIVDADATRAGGLVAAVMVAAAPGPVVPGAGTDRRTDRLATVVDGEADRGRDETPVSARAPLEGSPASAFPAPRGAPPATVVAVPAVVAGPGPPSDWETTAPVIRPAAASPLMTPVATHRWLSQEAATGAAAKAAERDRAAARAAAMAWPSSATRRWSSAGDCRGWGSGGCGMASDYGSPAGRRGIPLSRPGR